MSDESYPVNPADDPSSGVGFGTPASSGAASSTPKVRLEALSLLQLLVRDKDNYYLSACYFVLAEKQDGTRPDVPVITGVYSINAAPNPNANDPDLQKTPLRDLCLKRIAELLSLFTFTLYQEGAGASTPLGDYTLTVQYSPVAGNDTGPNGGTVDLPHGDSSLLDIAFLLQNFQIKVYTAAGLSLGTFQVVGECTNSRLRDWQHANAELGLPHGPMTLDCVVSLLSLLDWTVSSATSVGADGVGVSVGGKVKVCYTNKSHTG
jgi:hypothetical protein